MERLATFRDVAELGGIAAAARRTSRDPSAVSRQITGLEAELGVRLIQRTTRRLELTEAGEVYLRRIEPILDELEAAREAAQGLVERPRGRLRVTASSAFGQVVLAPLLASFQSDYPEVKLDLLLTDALVDLVAERVDVAVRLGPPPQGDVISARLRTAEMHLVASPDYLRTAGAPPSPVEVVSHKAIVSSTRNPDTWLFRREGEIAEIFVSGRIATSNTLVVRRCALDGLGVAILADWLVDDDLKAGRLQRLLPGWRAGVRRLDPGVWIAYPSRRFLPSKARVFIEHLRRHLK